MVEKYDLLKEKSAKLFANLCDCETGNGKRRSNPFFSSNPRALLGNVVEVVARNEDQFCHRIIVARFIRSFSASRVRVNYDNCIIYHVHNLTRF